MTKKVQQQVQTPVKYRDLISQSETQLQLEELDLNVQKSKSKLEVDISQTKYDLAAAKQKLAAVQRTIPYNVHDELKAYQEVVALEDGLAFAEEILALRF